MGSRAITILHDMAARNLARDRFRSPALHCWRYSYRSFLRWSGVPPCGKALATERANSPDFRWIFHRVWSDIHRIQRVVECHRPKELGLFGADAGHPAFGHWSYPRFAMDRRAYSGRLVDPPELNSNIYLHSLRCKCRYDRFRTPL